MIHTFEFQSRYFLLDVESGAIHLLDRTGFDVVRAMEMGLDPSTTPHSDEEIDEVLLEIASLTGEGMFASPAQEPPASAEQEQVIKAMCLHIAHDCNLRCKYCFADTGEFQGERQLMSAQTGKAALDFLIAHAGNRHNLEVDLFGGEPLMNFKVVKELVAYGRELEKTHDKTIRFTMTTNCIGLNEEIIAFINREMHNVVLSIDGRREIHDALRPTANGKPSYDTILPKAKALVDARGDREYYVRGTFTNRNLDFVQDVRALRDAGFAQISLEPVVLPESNPYAILEQHLGQIFKEYDYLAEFVRESEQDGHWFNFFHFMIDLGNGPCLRKRITGCGAGTEYVAVAPNGDLYPCHQFVGEDAFRMGNVCTGEFRTELQEQFSACNVRTKAACVSCWAKYFCSGGCAANAWKYNGDIMRPHEITCALTRKRTECAIGLNVPLE